MAKITFSKDSDFALRLQELEKVFDDDSILERAVAAGAKPVADAIRANLAALPTDRYRKLDPGETFSGLSKGQKEDLLNGFGLTPISNDRRGMINTHAGFDGYGSYPTKAYPKGVPNQLLARATESGSSVRDKTPFVRPAVNKMRKQSLQEMEKSVEEDIEKII